MQDHSHTLYTRMPTSDALSEDLACDRHSANLLKDQLAYLFPDDKLSRLLYLNEFVSLLEAGQPEIIIMIKLLQVAKNSRQPEGVIWSRKDNE